MYEDTFATDWDRLGREEAVRRAYAIGGATVLGEDLDDEYERVLSEGASNYGRNLVELAYNEGRRLASLETTKGDEAPVPDRVWRTLVDRTTVSIDDARAGEPAADRAMLGRPRRGKPSDRDLERVRLPSFLRWR
jgi:hypothetical protein